MSIDWCEELRNLETTEPNLSALPNGMDEIIRQLQPEPIWQATLKQGLVLLAYQAVGGNPSDLVTLAQRGNDKKSKPRRQGVCHDLQMGNCNPFHNGGEGCGKNGRLKAFCPLRTYFRKRKDGTISTKLNSEGLKLVRDYKLRQMSG